MIEALTVVTIGYVVVLVVVLAISLIVVGRALWSLGTIGIYRHLRRWA